MEAEQPREHPTSPMHHSAPAMPGDHPSLEGITVLAVDDEVDARKLLKRVLEDCGAAYSVMTPLADLVNATNRSDLLFTTWPTTMPSSFTP